MDRGRVGVAAVPVVAVPSPGRQEKPLLTHEHLVANPEVGAPFGLGDSGAAVQRGRGRAASGE